MAYQFIRQEPCYDHILFVLALDRDKMKERILIGTEQQIRFRLDGNKDCQYENVLVFRYQN